MESRPPPISIYGMYMQKCIPSFNTLCASLTYLKDEPSLKGSLPRVLDQLGRLQAWAGHSGAHRPGDHKISLDHKLREASHMHSRIRGFLAELGRDLQQAIATLQITEGRDEWMVGAQLQALEASTTLWDDSGSDNTNSTTETEDPAPRAPEELDSANQHNAPSAKTRARFEYVLRDIAHIINCLYELSITIQNPAARDKLHKYKDINVKHFEHFELLRAQDKFPELPQFLIDRLVKANLRRRQMFEYYRRHHQNIAGKPAETRPLDIIPEESLIPQQYPLPSIPVLPSSKIGPTISTKLNSQTTISAYIEPLGAASSDFVKPLEVQSEAGCSKTSFASRSTSAGNGSTGRLYIPNAPRNLDGTPFPCPFCFYIIRPKDSFSWIRHVVQDLQPYVCTFEDCNKPDRLFERRQEWYDHETQVHRRNWFCMKCSSAYPAPKLLMKHLISCHHDLPEELNLIIQRSEGAIQSPQHCPFGCKGDYSNPVLRGHLARHMQEMALFALPRLGYGEENETSSLPTMPAVVSARESKEGSKVSWPSEISQYESVEGLETPWRGPIPEYEEAVSSENQDATGDTTIDDDESAHDYSEPTHRDLQTMHNNAADLPGAPPQRCSLSPEELEARLITQAQTLHFRRLESPITESDPGNSSELLAVGVWSRIYKTRLNLPQCTPTRCEKCPPEMFAVKRPNEALHLWGRNRLDEAGILERLHTINEEYLEHLRHYLEYLVRYIGFVRIEGISYIFMEYIPQGNLEHYISRPWNESDVRIVAEQVFSALLFIHGASVVHRDIKPSKLYSVVKIDEEGNGYLSIKLGGFGCAKFVPPGDICETVIGTDLYSAPDRFDPPYTNAVDVWSTGCTLFRLLKGSGLFYSLKEICQYEFNREPSLDDALNDSCGKEAINFLKTLIEPLPENRASPTDALNHPWLQNNPQRFGNRMMTKGLTEHFLSVLKEGTKPKVSYGIEGSEKSTLSEFSYEGFDKRSTSGDFLSATTKQTEQHEKQG